LRPLRRAPTHLLWQTQCRTVCRPAQRLPRSLRQRSLRVRLAAAPICATLPRRGPTRRVVPRTPHGTRCSTWPHRLRCALPATGCSSDLAAAVVRSGAAADVFGQVDFSSPPSDAASEVAAPPAVPAALSGAHDAALQQEFGGGGADDADWLPDVLHARGRRRLPRSLQSLQSNTDGLLTVYDDTQQVASGYSKTSAPKLAELVKAASHPRPIPGRFVAVIVIDAIKVGPPAGAGFCGTFSSGFSSS